MEKLEPCAPCWCGSGKAYKDCHCAFDEKYESLRHPGVHLPPRRLIKNEAQIEKIRRSAKVNIAVLDYVAEHRPDVVLCVRDDTSYLSAEGNGRIG